jgi:hypothetical protein
MGALFVLVAVFFAVKAMLQLGRLDRARRVTLHEMSRTERRAERRERWRHRPRAVRAWGWAAMTLGGAYMALLFTVGQPRSIIAGPWALLAAISLFFSLRGAAQNWEQ